ncbi:MAG TPA: hypothetical protein DCQ98_22715 [Planctomycetaceae bacterium]|nr:hypothetical protein [Planctomycetaceae bacterium]HRF00015.1 hypothetical protein [Pirellulaceae bacterium]
MKTPTGALVLLTLSCATALAGCSAWPRAVHEPQLHNPFPQLERIAILPFFNQSASPNLDGLQVAEAYQVELQKIPGFQVMPVAVVDQYLRDSEIPIDSSTDFQKLARDLGVDVLVVGSVTVYDPYPPPKIGLAIDWYAANPGFHPIPAGYALPWGTAEEEFIPDELVREAEFELAKRQLETQTPRPAAADAPFPLPGTPADWPNPQGFIPPEPLRDPPPQRLHRGPLIESVRVYDASDNRTLSRLQVYHSWQEEVRPGGWKGYLNRSDDFIRFCCHMHLSELLAARGGVDRSTVAFRVPDGR